MKFNRKKKDIKRRVNYKKIEMMCKIKKLLVRTEVSEKLKRLLTIKYMKKKQNKQYKTKIRNFCIYTGRSRSVYTKLKASRIMLRVFGASGLFFGFKKAS
jgi:ribosomal protein S14